VNAFGIVILSFAGLIEYIPGIRDKASGAIPDLCNQAVVWFMSLSGVFS
jgi:hypothetical protein